MSRISTRLIAPAAGWLTGAPALAQPSCTLTQITHSTSGYSGAPSLDGGSIAFASTANPAGSNPDGNQEIFLFSGSSLTQITRTTSGGSFYPSLDGRAIAFASNADPTGDNPDGNPEIFLYDGSAVVQLTHSTRGASYTPSLEGGVIAFSAEADLTGGNPDLSREIFLQRPGSRSPSWPRPGLGGAPRLPVQGPDHGRRPGLRRDPGGRLRRRDAVRERCPAGPFRALFAGHRPPAERIPVGEPGAVHAEAMALEIDTHPAGSANVFTFRITECVGFRHSGSLQCSRKNVPGMAIVHFAQRSWLTEILINSGAAVVSAVVKYPKSKAVHNPPLQRMPELL